MWGPGYEVPSPRGQRPARLRFRGRGSASPVPTPLPHHSPPHPHFPVQAPPNIPSAGEGSMGPLRGKGVVNPRKQVQQHLTPGSWEGGRASTIVGGKGPTGAEAKKQRSHRPRPPEGTCRLRQKPVVDRHLGCRDSTVAQLEGLVSMETMWCPNSPKQMPSGPWATLPTPSIPQ